MIQTIEELSLNAWPALQTKFFDGWILRFAAGYTKRANSISPIYPSTLALPEKIAYCEAAYRRQNLPVIFKLTPDSFPAELDRELENRKYIRLDETSVRLMPLSAYQYRKPAGIVTENQFTGEWLQAYYACSNLNTEFHNSARMLVSNIVGEIVVIRKQVDGVSVGCGFGAMDRGLIGIYDIVVAPKYRGHGYGRDIMNGILSAACEKGVETAYLSVVVGNTAAENLYQKIGFQEIYRYWYRKII